MTRYRRRPNRTHSQVPAIRRGDVQHTCETGAGDSERPGSADPIFHPVGRVAATGAGFAAGVRRRSFADVCPRNDDGALVAFVLLLLLALWALLGLVVDGGAALTAHQAAEVEAEQAARSGAGAISVDALRSGSVQLDAGAAASAAERFSTASGHPGTATVSGGIVTVTIHYQVPTTVLGIIGIRTISVNAVASAVDLHGVTRGEA